MASVKGDIVNVLLWLCLLGSSTAKLALNSTWVESDGFFITCYWEVLPNDTLQSLRIYRNGDQIIFHRPEIHGIHNVEITHYSDRFTVTKASCDWLTRSGKSGNCLVYFKLYTNVQPTEDTFRCQTSGERPTFRLEEQEYSFYVPPSGAVLKQSNHSLRPTLDCTSSGLPPPKLIWTVEGQKIPEDFTHTKWNSTTKLWDSWSSYNPQKEQVTVMCIPEATTKTGRVERGAPAEWVVETNGGDTGLPRIFFMVFLMLLAVLLR